jgi:hypothetical protein
MRREVTLLAWARQFFLHLNVKIGLIACRKRANMEFMRFGGYKKSEAAPQSGERLRLRIYPAYVRGHFNRSEKARDAPI